MNVIRGEIVTVNVKGSLSLIHIKVSELHLSAILIDTPETAPYLVEGNSVNLIFKETEVIITTDIQPKISLQNRLAGVIKSIEEGSLLSKIILNTEAGEITSIITTNAVSQLGLTEGSEVIAMIKTNEMMLSE